MSRFETKLTAAQRRAIEHRDGPLLVVAGPGSGKTLTVTQRLAAILESGIPARNVLAVTFTNKAAREMADRLESLVGSSDVLVTTFHKFCARLLRQHASYFGLQTNYTILDVPDQRRLMKQSLDALGIDTTHYPADRVLNVVSNAKNDLVAPEAFAQSFDESVGDHFQAIVSRAYPAYQKGLLASNAVDFDDLLLLTAVMLRDNEALRESLGERYRYVMVDEYQDTNLAQYETVVALASRHRNVCVTGDPDQSIYGWRGARIENILNFERDFPEATVLQLEANFRSTGEILRTADELIQHNHRRKAKTLTTTGIDGTPVTMVKFDDDRAEADAIAFSIEQRVSAGTASWSDFAVFYRVNSLSRSLEMALTRLRIPYQVAQSTAFYDRTEVKDILAYLRVLANPSDRTAFQRIVNKPARRLGQTSQKRLEAWADESGLTLFEAAARANECSALGKPARGGFRMFAESMSSVLANDTGSVAELIRAVIDRTGYLKPFEGRDDEKSEEVVANVEELVSAALHYDRRFEGEATLEGFLEEASLVSDTDELQDSSAGQVTLMTLHAAKGLEFNNVYIIGIEQGILPHERSLRENTLDELEEERRLLFVGITRARNELTLTHTSSRATRGRIQISIQSQFTSELAVKHIDSTSQLAGSVEYRAERAGRRWSRDDEWDEPSVDVNADVGNDDADREFASTDDGTLAMERSVETEPSDSTNPSAREMRASNSTTLRQSHAAGDRSSDLPSKLTTAADLLAGTRRRVDIGSLYHVGQQVRHPHYGVGTVSALGEVNRRKKVTVDFGHVEETFIIGLSPLEPVRDPE